MQNILSGIYYAVGKCFMWDIPHLLHRRTKMPANAIRSYDAKIDSKKRITLRNALFEYFHVEEYDDGTIVLEPRELAKPFSVSANTLAMMDSSIANLKNGVASDPIDLSVIGDD